MWRRRVEELRYPLGRNQEALRRITAACLRMVRLLDNRTVDTALRGVCKKCRTDHGWFCVSCFVVIYLSHKKKMGLLNI